MPEPQTPASGPLLWSEAIRALVCMAPMPVAYALGNTSHLVSLGQGAFFYSALFLPTRQRTRLLMGSIILALGLGFYLIGGNVVPNPWEAILFTFFVAVNLSFLSGWRIGTWQLGGSLALTFIMIYTAGLNTGSPAEASGNFLALAGVMAWAAAVSLLPFWRPIEPPPGEALTLGDTVEQGVRTGIGMSLALFVSYLFGFLSFGWAPSAVGHIVRYDEKVTHLRAWARFLGTIGGATLALLALVLFHNLTALIYAALVFGSLNGLFKAHRIGQMPFFYTATIILLYSAFDIDSGPKIAFQRVAYNMVGITLGLLVVLYPFPMLMRRIHGRAQPDRNNAVVQ